MKNLRSPRLRRARASCTILLIAATLPIVLSSAPALGQTDPGFIVKVTIEHLRDVNDDLDCGTLDPACTDADFYAVVNIDGQEFNNEDTPSSDAFEGQQDIRPNWEFSPVQPIPSSKGAIGVVIEVRDEDGFLRANDDHADLDPKGGTRNLELTVNLSPCSVDGDVVGACGSTLSSVDNGEDGTLIEFRIDVTDPPSAPGLNVQCIHTPIWPQAGAPQVTITANALDGALSAKRVDKIEVWVNDRTQPALETVGRQTTLTHTLNPPFGNTFTYGCRVIDQGVAVFTGWRTVNIGQANTQVAVPILYTGGRPSRLDMVFLADRTSYTGNAFDDPNFITAVGSVILQAYYSYTPFLENQDKFNFWIALASGDAEDASKGCDHDAPDYAWADATILLHTDSLRDCAPGGMRLFSSEPFNINTVRHESGHRPFGLADEYSGDGGYFQSAIFPNVYKELDDCAAGSSNPATCREINESIDWWPDKDWSVSDPSGDDLMEDSGPHTAQADDVRRILWVFSECSRAAC